MTRSSAPFWTQATRVGKLPARAETPLGFRTLMKPKVYLETTIVSYLTGWTSRDLVTAARQQITQEWWQTRREDFDLFASQIVMDEAGAGDADAAARRLEFMSDLPLLNPSDDVADLAQALLDEVPLPAKAAADALHIAVATVNGIDFLLTWNCTHIANATLRGNIEAVCRSRGYEPPIICTPEELLKG